MTTVVNKETFEITKDGKQITLAVNRPGPEEGRKAQVHYNRTFAQALTAGGLLRDRVSAYMREQGLWDDKKEEQQRGFGKQLADMELRIKGGGIKLSEARKIALDMRKVRSEFRELLTTKNSLDVSTVEGQAENARFNALVSLCLVYNESGEPYYKSVDDYLEHSIDPEAFQAASLLGQMMFHLDKDYEVNLPENLFLKRFKFVDPELRLINKDGRLVDEDGRLINSEGRYIKYTGETDDKGQPITIFVDRDGKPVDVAGNYVVTEQPFLDDDGNPIVEAPVEPTSSEAVQTAS